MMTTASPLDNLSVKLIAPKTKAELDCSEQQMNAINFQNLIFFYQKLTVLCPIKSLRNEIELIKMICDERPKTTATA